MYSEAASVKPETTLSEALEVMFKARYHDVLVEKDGVFQGVVTWNEIMKVKQEQRSQLRVEQLPMRKISVFLTNQYLKPIR
jgi:CBS domain-containing protein